MSVPAWDDVAPWFVADPTGGGNLPERPVLDAGLKGWQGCSTSFVYAIGGRSTGGDTRRPRYRWTPVSCSPQLRRMVSYWRSDPAVGWTSAVLVDVAVLLVDGGVNPRRTSAPDSSPVRPVRSASSRNATLPAYATTPPHQR